MKIYADQGVNQRKLAVLKKQYGFDVIQAHSIEQNIPIAENVPHPFTIGISMIDGGDYIAGDDIHDVGNIVGGTVVGKGGGTDVLHIYTAHKADCEFFVTNNPKDFIYSSKKDRTDGKRQQLEEILSGMKIVTLDEFEESIREFYDVPL